MAPGLPNSVAHTTVPVALGLLVLVNPEVLSMEGVAEGREGCLSVPDFTANVRRAARLRLRAFDQSGALRTLTLDGFEAVIAQHELDHLDGKLFLDRVVNLKTDVFRRQRYG